MYLHIGCIKPRIFTLDMLIFTSLIHCFKPKGLGTISRTNCKQFTPNLQTWILWCSIDTKSYQYAQAWSNLQWFWLPTQYRLPACEPHRCKIMQCIAVFRQSWPSRQICLLSLSAYGDETEMLQVYIWWCLHLLKEFSKQRKQKYADWAQKSAMKSWNVAGYGYDFRSFDQLSQDCSYS